jgi:hypothetical protein
MAFAQHLDGSRCHLRILAILVRRVERRRGEEMAMAAICVNYVEVVLFGAADVSVLMSNKRIKWTV